MGGHRKEGATGASVKKKAKEEERGCRSRGGEPGTLSSPLETKRWLVVVGATARAATPMPGAGHRASINVT